AQDPLGQRRQGLWRAVRVPSTVVGEDVTSQNQRAAGRSRRSLEPPGDRPGSLERAGTPGAYGKAASGGARCAYSPVTLAVSPRRRASRAASMIAKFSPTV